VDVLVYDGMREVGPVGLRMNRGRPRLVHTWKREISMQRENHGKGGLSEYVEHSSK
jgi:hypothetical protein